MFKLISIFCCVVAFSLVPFAEARGYGASSSSEALVLSLINSARARGVSCRGGGGVSVPALRYDPVLHTAAKAHAFNMANHNFMSHYFRGVGPRSRVTRAGYRYSRMSEIIYKFSGRSSPASAVRWWLRSPVHCRAIMNRYYTEFAAAYGGSGAWVVEMTQAR